MKTLPTAEQITLDWNNNPRWTGVQRNYSAEDVVRLRGTVAVEHSLARRGAERLWKSLHQEEFVNALKDKLVLHNHVAWAVILGIRNVLENSRKQENQQNKTCQATDIF